MAPGGAELVSSKQMKLSTLDLTIVLGYVAAMVALGLYMSRRATGSIDDYFVGGRSLPWWLAGTSMIASAFAIDTPFGITGLVAKNGVKGVWFAWTYILGGAGTFGAFIFASMLRRSNVITAAELIELRYSGKAAAFLRGFKSIYFGILTTCISMGIVIRSVLVVSEEALGWDAFPTLVVLIALTMIYTTASGLWGVAVTDFAQFFVGSFGLLALAYFALGSVGGLSGLTEAVSVRYGAEAVSRLHFVPRPDSEFFFTFMVFITLKWWGNPPGALTQRIMSTKDERHATLATVLFAIVHFAINYWPMILIALVSLVTFPELPVDKAERGYAMLMIKVLPPGFLGISLAASTAALMSTVDTQINMGASYMVNDIYRRFIKPEASKKHYVRASQVSTVIMLALAITAATFMDSVQSAWYYMAMLTAGYGFVVVARWFWWRINAWSELASLTGSLVGSLLANHVLDLPKYGQKFIFAASISLTAWVVVTLLTPPSSPEHLAAFARAVKPYPLGWGPVRRANPDIEWSPQLPRSVALFLIGSAAILCICFGLGNLVLGTRAGGLGLLSAAGILMAVILRYWRP